MLRTIGAAVADDCKAVAEIAAAMPSGARSHFTRLIVPTPPAFPFPVVPPKQRPAKATADGRRQPNKPAPALVSNHVLVRKDVQTLFARRNSDSDHIRGVRLRGVHRV